MADSTAGDHAGSSGAQGERWLVLADDLTGAADCAIAFASRGHATVVTWSGGVALPAGSADVLAHDADSRGLGADAAAARQAEALELHAAGRRLYKKIDSTLRGQPGAEIAAAVRYLRTRDGAAFGILAPAFPELGRTTIGGRIRVAGAPLERTELWRRDRSYASSDLIAMLATAGLWAEAVPLAAVRAGTGELDAAFRAMAADGADVAVCDAETDDDLLRIARAGRAASPAALFAGSAGLARALAARAPPGTARAAAVAASRYGTLIVVGSVATASREAARALLASGDVVHLPVEPATLLADPPDLAVGRAASCRLAAGEDVLVEIRAGGDPDPSLGPRLAAGLGRALGPVAPRLGALAATGGETAAALLTALGIGGIRLIDEVEPGIPLGVGMGALAIPIVTKAGAFGNEGSLRRVADRLRAVRSKGVAE